MENNMVMSNPAEHSQTIPLNAEQHNRCYTIADLMEILGVGRKSIMSLLRQKLFPWIVIGGTHYRIPKSTFDAWLTGDH